MRIKTLLSLLIILFTISLALADDSFKITSPAFNDGDHIPVKYAYTYVKGGKNISIPLKIGNVPPETKSIAIIMWDKHKIANEWVHWIVANLPPKAMTILEGASGKNLPAGSVELINSYGKKGYGGPGPPAGSGLHEYEIVVFALSVDKLDVKNKMSTEEFFDLVEDRIIDEVVISGFFEVK